jgi:hypothetical protein
MDFSCSPTKEVPSWLLPDACPTSNPLGAHPLIRPQPKFGPYPLIQPSEGRPHRETIDLLWDILDDPHLNKALGLPQNYRMAFRRPRF